MESKQDDAVLIEAQWDRTNYCPCSPCYVGVDDLGVFQCRDCLCVFMGREACKHVIKCLKEQYQDLWEEEYRKLKEIRTLVRANKLNELVLYAYTYRDENGKIYTDRYFYEKRP